jgi:phospholipase C
MSETADDTAAATSVRFVLIASFLLCTAACGGGSGASSSGPGPVPQPTSTVQPGPSPSPVPTATPPAGALQHLVFIVQENRSFDSYFGTFPGANGIPTSPPCQIDTWHPSECPTPYVDHKDTENGGAYDNASQISEVDGGKMDGFVAAAEAQLPKQCAGGAPPRHVMVYDPERHARTESSCEIDVMGHHDGTDLPNYWKWASSYVLMDNFYESVESYSLPAHLAIFSGWSAECADPAQGNPDTCVSLASGDVWDYQGGVPEVYYLWTDITYALFRSGVQWKVYNDGVGIDPQGSPFSPDGVDHLWNVLPGFETVENDGQLPQASKLVSTDFASDAANGTLPAVSWVLPDWYDSEHPSESISQGQSYTTALVNAIESGPASQWEHTAIFIVWDDIGGFYDHQPPGFNFDSLGLGMRVPAIIISPLAKNGYIDHSLCSTDCFLRLIENTFLNGNGIATYGRSDPRPDYRDTQSAYGDLRNDFNLTAPPRKPMLLKVHPMTLLQPPAPHKTVR